MVSYAEFNNVADPLAYVFEKINLSKVGFFISVSAVIAATSVLLVFQIGQPRIWMSMSRDGLMPKRFGKIHPRFQTPGFSTIVTGIIVAIPSLFVESAIMTDLTSIGTLFAFVLVCGGVLLLPKKEKSAEKKFNLPYINGQWIVIPLFFIFLYTFRERLGDAIVNIAHDTQDQILFILFVMMFAAIAILSFTKKLSLIPVLGMICCLYLMIEIPTSSWIVFFGWMAFGLVIYFMYGYWKSKLSNRR